MAEGRGTIARARFREAQAGVRTALQIPNPSLGFEDLSRSVASPAAWTVSPVIDFLLETAGKRARRTQQARALTRAALEDLATASWLVRAGVRDGLLASWAAERRLALARQHLKYQADLTTLLEHRLAVGDVSALDVERERVNTSQLRLAVGAIEQQAADARTALARAIGVPVRALESVRLSFAGLEAPEAPPDEALLQRVALSGRTHPMSLGRGPPDFLRSGPPGSSRRRARG
ncbi:MAG: TolC family protein [Steroidobacteraceae bacterium]